MAEDSQRESTEEERYGGVQGDSQRQGGEEEGGLGAEGCKENGEGEGGKEEGGGEAGNEGKTSEGKADEGDAGNEGDACHVGQVVLIVNVYVVGGRTTKAAASVIRKTNKKSRERRSC